MSDTLANQCPSGNTQAPIRLVIHGPRWKNTMPYDAHAMTVVVPSLTKHGWKFEANEQLQRFELFSPWFEECAP
tara:strand:- start:1833 stop:2054 length:222 start_codon:yes stop_codon:yes gene_type:complete